MKNWVSKPWDPGFWDPENHRPSRFLASTRDGGAVRHLAGMPRMIFGAASATDAYHELTWSVTWMIYPHEPYSGYSGLLKRAIFLPNRWEIFRVLQIENVPFLLGISGYLPRLSLQKKRQTRRGVQARREKVGPVMARPTWGESW